MRQVCAALFGLSLVVGSTAACDEQSCPRTVTVEVPDGGYSEPSGLYTERNTNVDDGEWWFPHGVMQAETFGGGGGEGGAGAGFSERGPGVIPSGKIAIDRAAGQLVRSFVDAEMRAVTETYHLVEGDGDRYGSCDGHPYDVPESTALELQRVILDGALAADHTAYEGWSVSLSGELNGDDAAGSQGSYSVVTFTAARSSEGGYRQVFWEERYVP